jgi:integrase
MDWVMTGSYVGHPYRDEHRLEAIRAFLQQVRTLDEGTKIPQATLRTRYRRRAPYIFADQEIVQLMEAASRNRLTLRATTVSTLIGLLASTGIRIGEALRLTLDDVRIDATPPHLFIHETKFGKSRNVVLHPSTASHLRRYLVARKAALRGCHAVPLFTNTLRKP